ncbi:hypothetical protein MMC34_006236 [Xylographa carneopallida]|nr:hypothetical protein [Xylographa carneopallida]
MYISASIAAAILLTPVLGTLNPYNQPGKVPPYHAPPAAHAAAAHPPPRAAPKPASARFGQAVTGALGNVDPGKIAAGIDTAARIIGSGQGLMEQVQGLKSSFGNGASSSGAAGEPASSGLRRRSIYADPGIYERDIDDLYERDWEGLDERDLDNLYERDLEGLDKRDLEDLYERGWEALDERGFETLYERDWEGLNERDLDGLYERDIYDLYERGFGAEFEDVYE